MRRAVPLALLAMILGACAEPLEFADWTIPVPEGTRVIEYAAVPVDERNAEIALEQDLVIGAGSEVIFYRPTDLAIDDDGRIYVLDAGADDIKVFDRDGSHLATWGGPGQGPGELQSPISIAFAGDGVIVSDSVNRRLATWSLDGELISDKSPPSLLQFLSISGVTEDGPFIGRYIDSESGEVTYIVAAFTREGDKLHEFFRHPNPPDPGLPLVPDLLPLRSLFVFAGYHSAVDRGARAIFFANGAAYQVLAFAPEGKAEWALRVSGSPDPYSAAAVNEVMVQIREHLPEAQVDDFNWPARFPALARITTDGRGHLFVYPYVADATPDSVVPVDVYTLKGERVFTGLIRNIRWTTAAGDYVYGLGRDPSTDETTVNRYRVLIPEGGP